MITIKKTDVKNLKKIGKLNEAISIINNCECGNISQAKVTDLNKLRKWEIIEVIGNYLDPSEKEVEWWDIKQLRSFCKAFEIEEDKIAELYAEAVCEGGYEIAYPLTENIVLIIE